VPIGKNLLDVNILTAQDKQWINKYHQECRNVLEPLLNNDSKTLSWIERETEPLL
jgi:Xaa-Pro aminopeptidase